MKLVRLSAALRARAPADRALGLVTLEQAENPLIRLFAQAGTRYLGPWPLQRTARLAGWGRRPSGMRAARLARAWDVPLVLFEDGFLRSYAPRDQSWSLVADHSGIYYDARTACDFDSLVGVPLSPGDALQADRVADLWRDLGLSKLNHQPPVTGLPQDYVLVVDQRRGDLSISCGLAGPDSFARMLARARSDHPGAAIVVKGVPDGLGHLGRGDLRPGERHLSHADPAQLIRGAAQVYCVTSQMGFEALIHGRPVTCLGMPFYAGRGLTLDDLPAPVHRAPVPLAQLIHAALIRYPIHADPGTGTPLSAPEAMTAIAALRDARPRVARLHALGVSRWKHPHLRRFLPGTEVVFCAPSDVPAGADVAIWGDRVAAGAVPQARVVARIEDGFLRSAGLGADLTPPLSWIFDELGLHYDPSGPSRVEAAIAGARDPALLARAARLRAMLVARGVTKYNLAGARWTRPDRAEVRLVVGQVETDVSVRLGAGKLRCDRDLLAAVRAAHPEAWLVYRPHPDVVAGLRAGESIAALRMGGDVWGYDEIAAAADPLDLLAGVDAVDVITSGLGFEALLRGVPVTCHGAPFYAGWGLSADAMPTGRRRDAASCEALVAGALILAPAYADARGRAISPEAAVIALARAKAARPGPIRRAILRALAKARGRF